MQKTQNINLSLLLNKLKNNSLNDVFSQNAWGDAAQDFYTLQKIQSKNFSQILPTEAESLIANAIAFGDDCNILFTSKTPPTKFSSITNVGLIIDLS